MGATPWRFKSSHPHPWPEQAFSAQAVSVSPCSVRRRCFATIAAETAPASLYRRSSVIDPPAAGMALHQHRPPASLNIRCCPAQVLGVTRDLCRWSLVRGLRQPLASHSGGVWGSARLRLYHRCRLRLSSPRLGPAFLRSPVARGLSRAQNARNGVTANHGVRATATFRHVPPFVSEPVEVQVLSSA